jgi:hypothetical protein
MAEKLGEVLKGIQIPHKAYPLYLTRNPVGQAQLLQIVLLNCAIDGTSIRPTYKKPFDLIFQRAQDQEWSGREDLNLRPPGPELSQYKTPSALAGVA